MPKAKRSYARADRINQQLLEILAQSMLREVRDPRVQGVQLTAVEVSSDLSVARVYYIILTGGEPAVEVQRALERVSAFLRRQAAAALQIKHMPNLEFRYDESIERGRRMDALLDAVLPAASQDDEETGDETPS